MPSGSGVPSDGTTPTTIVGTDTSLILPAGWLALDAQTSVSVLQAAASTHSDLGTALGQLQNGQLDMVAFDAAATGGGQPPAVTILRTGDAISVTSLLEALARTTAQQIQDTESVSGKINATDVKLKNGTGVEISYTLRGTMPIGVDDYMISVGGHTWLLSFTAPASDVAGFRPVFISVVKSLSGG